MKADWSKAYSLGDEIQNYLVDCWKYARLVDHTKFNTEVTKAVWDKNQNKWSLTLKTGNKEEIVFYNWFIRFDIFVHNLRMLKTLKLRVVRTQAIFVINVGKRRIRHIMNLAKFKGEFLDRLKNA